MVNDNNLKIYNDGMGNPVLAIWPAFDLPIIDDLPDPFPVELLATTDFANVVGKLAGEVVRTNNIPDACELINRLRLRQSFKSGDPQTYNFYESLVTILKFVSLDIRKDKEVKILLNESLVYALKNGVDVVSNLEDYLKYDEEGLGVDKNSRRGLIYSLETNQEKLGQQQLILDSGRAQPTVQNWLKSYNNSQHLTSDRSKFSQINYLNTSADVRVLGGDEKAVLGKILEMYDKLLFPPPGPEVVPDNSPEAQQLVKELAYFSSDKYTLPQEILRSEQSVQPPVVPVPKNVPEQREMEEVQRISNETLPPSLPPLGGGTGTGVGTLRVDRTDRSDRSDRSDMAGGSAPQTFNRVNFQDVLKNRDQAIGNRQQGGEVAGLRMGGGGGKIPNPKSQIPNGDKGGKSPSAYILNPLLEKKPVLPQKGQAKQEEIDRKLEELKKKIK
jgi:hypothetical protein